MEPVEKGYALSRREFEALQNNARLVGGVLKADDTTVLRAHEISAVLGLLGGDETTRARETRLHRREQAGRYLGHRGEAPLVRSLIDEATHTLRRNTEERRLGRLERGQVMIGPLVMRTTVDLLRANVGAEWPVEPELMTDLLRTYDNSQRAAIRSNGNHNHNGDA